jgi:hypothetical protein
MQINKERRLAGEATLVCAETIDYLTGGGCLREHPPTEIFSKPKNQSYSEYLPRRRRGERWSCQEDGMLVC